MDTLAEWLNHELKRRGWSQRELARRAGISRSQVSNVISGGMSAGVEFCLAVAPVLEQPPERLLRLAGILPPEPAAVSEEREALRLIRSIDHPVKRKAALDMLRGLAGQRRPTIAPTELPGIDAVLRGQFDTLVETSSREELEAWARRLEGAAKDKEGGGQSDRAAGHGVRESPGDVRAASERTTD